MTGMDEVVIGEKLKSHPDLKPKTRLTKGVVGIQIGPKTRHGWQTTMTFNHLTIHAVSIGIRLGIIADDGPDVRELSFRVTSISHSRIGIWAASGNLASVMFNVLNTNAYGRAENDIRIDGGEILVCSWNSNGCSHNPAPGNAAVQLNAGGIQIIQAWCEWTGPFLRTSKAMPERGNLTGGSVSFPVILQGVHHFDADIMYAKYPRRGEKKPRISKYGRKPGDWVPLSIIYNRPVPLHLIGCSFWGGISLGSESESVIIDQGTVFIDKNSVGFTGEGISKYGRLVRMGTRDPKNGRILQPYILDRRHIPGTAPPTTGVWKRGDRILNIEPDPTNPAKAWAGWICVEGGEPGRWAPFGLLGKAIVGQSSRSSRSRKDRRR